MLNFSVSLTEDFLLSAGLIVGIGPQNTPMLRQRLIVSRWARAVRIVGECALIPYFSQVQISSLATVHRYGSRPCESAASTFSLHQSQ